MIQKINLNPIVFKSYKSTHNENSNENDNQQREFNSEFYVDKKVAEAIKAKNFVSNPAEIDKPLSYDDYIKQLKNANLVENKDYEVNEYETNEYKRYYVDIIKSGNTEPYKTVYWHNGKGVENYDGYENYLYPMTKNQPTIYLRYDRDGILEDTIKEYSNPDAHKDLYPEDIDINTTPKEYVKILDSKNIKYYVKKVATENDEVSTYIYELDNDGNERKIVTFVEYPNKSNKYVSCIYISPNDGIIKDFEISKNDDFYMLRITENEKNKGNKIKNTVKY